MSGPPPDRERFADAPFVLALGLLGGLYVALIAALLLADLAHTSVAEIARAFRSPAIRSAVGLSLLSCSAAAIVAVWVGVPLGYLLSRTRFPGRGAVDLLLDVPILLPPVVVGLSLLILFQTRPGQWFQAHVAPVTYAVAGVVLAQVTVSAAFAARTMRVAFDQIDPRAESIALTLGCG
ncbi:MAG TPA: molybdenum ABC transporter permease, partial [Gemmata sp.]